MRRSLRHQLIFGSLGTAAWPPLVLLMLGWPAYAPLPLISLAAVYLLTVLGFTLSKQSEVYARRDLWLRYAGFLATAALIICSVHYIIGVHLKKTVPGADKVLFYLTWGINAALIVPLLSGYNQLILPESKRPRGRVLKSDNEVQQAVEVLQEGTDAMVCLAGLELDKRKQPPHNLVIGATRSGKSLTLELLYQSVVPTIVPGSDRRALFHDPKGTLYSRISGMSPQVPIRLINAMDVRGWAWWISADIDEPVLADELASILIPDRQGNGNAFFTNNARALVAGVIKVFILTCPREWDLWHVILVSTNLKRLRYVLSQTPETRELLENFQREETLQDILSTVFSEVGKYRTLAGLWRDQPKFSLKDWLQDEVLLILSADPKIEAQMRAMMRLFIKRLSQMINSQEDSNTRETYLFLDEARLMGRLDGLSEAMLFGGSKGLKVTISYQDHDGWCDVYGPRVGNEMANQCGNLLCMKLDSPSSAEYVCKRIGEGEYMEEQISRSITPTDTGQDRTTVNVSEQRVRRQVVLPSELMDIPYPSPETGLTGYYILPSIGAFKRTYFPDLWPPDESVPNFIPRPVSDQYERPWDDTAEYDQLKLTGTTALPQKNASSLPSGQETPSQKPKGKSKLANVKRLGDDMLP